LAERLALSRVRRADSQSTSDGVSRKKVSDASVAERAILRHAITLEVELERMQTTFALAGEASAEALDTYARIAGNHRRLLESVGLERRAKTVGPTFGELLRQDAIAQQVIDNERADRQRQQFEQRQREQPS